MSCLLKDDVQKILDMAVVNFQNDGILAPVLLGVFEGKKKLIALNFDLKENKELFVGTLLNLIEQGKLTEYILVIEAWMVKDNQGKEIDKIIKQHNSLQSHPQRREVLMVQYCTPIEEIHFISEIQRGTNPVSLSEWEKLELSNSYSQGRMQSLFKKGRAVWN